MKTRGSKSAAPSKPAKQSNSTATPEEIARFKATLARLDDAGVARRLALAERLTRRTARRKPTVD